ncbi:MAG: DUF1849 family protein [Alphaproteobacteria bacterium]|jgi:hypothetical protein|nr:DUF1849 family protein [Alphaproteobacteria bacterium]MDP6567387.1 DUF1849 family protein [Alphaproteobacteria bacterium]MDP6813096.1 DUF1849 family protein [Alphaproteobacteria bacterium]
MSVRWLVRLSGLLLLAVAGSAALAPAVAQKIRPARAIYDLSLGKKGAGVELESLTGRLALELIETCEGAIFNQGFVTRSVQTTGEELFGDVQASLWESRDGRRFRFTQLSRSSGQEDEESRGGAELFPDGGGIARWSLPKPAEITLPRGTLFSVGYSKRVLEMAATGSRGFEVPLFDGAGEAGLYRAHAFIGKGMKPAAISSSQPAPLPRWPIRLAYFRDDDTSGLPDYEVGFVLYGTGVINDIVIDYGEFTILGRLAALNYHDPPSCGD